MKTAIIFSDGIKQIMFTPENDDEKQALKLITANDDIHLAIQTGTFAEAYHRPGFSSDAKPFSANVSMCRGGYLRTFSNEHSIMLVLTPKAKEEIKNPDSISG